MKRVFALFTVLFFLVAFVYGFNGGGGWQTALNDTTMQLELEDFIQVGDDYNEGVDVIAPLTESTSPNVDKQNRLRCLVWDDGDTSYAQVTFRVPRNYGSGGKFRAFVDYDTGSVAPPIYWEVWVNKDGTAWDTAATTQTQVTSGGTAGTPELVDLAITTDFDALVAGDIVTFMITRSDYPSSNVADLELYYVDFFFED